MPHSSPNSTRARPPSPPMPRAWPQRLAEVQRAARAKVVAESQSKRERFDAARPAAAARARGPAASTAARDFLELSPLAGLGMHDDDGKQDRAGRRQHRRHRRRRRQARAGLGQRQRRQGRHRRADGAEEGAARAGDRAREQAAADRAGGVGRRQPDVPGRDLRRRRPHLRQPGAAVGRRHPADRGRARLVHRRRRLPAGPERLRGAGARPLAASTWPARRW